LLPATPKQGAETVSSENPAGGEQWASRIGVILAVAGSAVGLGNFLRFPGQAAQNGGGAFMVPYFISLLLLGIPLCWAEWTMGRYAGIKGFHSAPGIFQVLWRNPLAKYFGAIALLIPLVIYMYYVVIEAWCLGYAYNYLTADLMLGEDAAAYGSFFSGFVGAEKDGALFESGNQQLLVMLLVTFALNFALIYRGVSKGIESFCKVAMPIMVVCALCVLVRVLTLGTDRVVAGLGAMWNPDPEFLWEPKTWLAASGQIFFSLSVGFGIVINYASYLRRNDDVALSGLTASSMNEFFEVCLGGLITLPAAFIFLGAAATTQGTFGLGFNALPNVFAVMPGGRFFGFLWFSMLFLAALTSSLSMLQPVIAFFEEGLGLRRHASAAFLGLLSALGCGFVVFFSQGSVALDTFDFWVGTLLIFILALIQSIIYGWAFGIEHGYKELHRGAHIRVPWFVQLLLKYVTPAYLLAIFVGFCYTQGPTYAETLSKGGVPLYSVLFIGTIFAFLLLLIHIAGKRWHKEGRFSTRPQ
jgi:SNF family Na+-dependent transporter